MTDDIVTRLQQRVDLTALVARAALGDATVCEEAAAEINRLREAVKDLAAKIDWMIDVSYAWSEDGCFTFPDGDVWRKRG